MRSTTPVLLLMALGAGLAAGPAGAQSELPVFDTTDPRQAYDDMSEYLSRDGGRWIGENPNHDPERRRSPTHFGLWFEWTLAGQVLDLTIVAHFSDTTLVSSESRWAWNPAEAALTYRSVAFNGSYSEGFTTFVDASAFRTLTTSHAPSGEGFEHRDDNVIVDDTTHRNESFRREPNGDWVSTGEWVWVRETQ